MAEPNFLGGAGNPEDCAAEAAERRTPRAQGMLPACCVRERQVGKRSHENRISKHNRDGANENRHEVSWLSPAGVASDEIAIVQVFAKAPAVHWTGNQPARNHLHVLAVTGKIRFKKGIFYAHPFEDQ